MSQVTPPTDERASRMKFWGTAVILLMMVLMLFSTNIASQFARGRGGPGDIEIGTASNGRRITANEKSQASGFLNIIDRLAIQFAISGPDGTSIPQTAKLTSAFWGDSVSRDLSQHPEAVALLIQEADTNGPGASGYALGSLDSTLRSPDSDGLMNSGRVSLSDLHPSPDSPLGRLMERYNVGQLVQVVILDREHPSVDGHVPSYAVTDQPPKDQEAYYAAFRTFLAIQSAGALRTSESKISQPMLQRAIAENRQRYTLELAEFDAKPKLTAATQPSDDQMLAQLNAHADVAPGKTTRENPFGFGYRVPDRVELEMIAVKRDDVRTLVRAEKTDYDWEVDARKAFRSNPSDFIKRLPATHPVAVASTQPNPPAAKYDDIKDQAVKIEIERAVDSKVDEIKKRIHSTMQYDYLAWFNAQAQQHAAGANTPATAPAVDSSTHVPYTQPAYVESVAALIEQNFHVKPTVEHDTDRMRDIQALENLKPFGMAMTESANAEDKVQTGLPVMPAADYAVGYARPLMSAAKQQTAGESVLDLFEPSEWVQTDDGDSILFRVVAAEPNHPAAAKDLNDLRPRLVADCQMLEAQRQTFAEADAAAKAAPATAPLAIAEHPTNVITIGPMIGPDQTPVPPTLNLNANAATQFVDRLNDTLMADTSKTPVVAIDVPLAQRVYVVRRVSAIALLGTPAEQAQLRTIFRERLAQRLDLDRIEVEGEPDGESTSNWLNVKDILARNEYKADR